MDYFELVALYQKHSNGKEVRHSDVRAHLFKCLPIYLYQVLPSSVFVWPAFAVVPVFVVGMIMGMERTTWALVIFYSICVFTGLLAVVVQRKMKRTKHVITDMRFEEPKGQPAIPAVRGMPYSQLEEEGRRGDHGDDDDHHGGERDGLISGSKKKSSSSSSSAFVAQRGIDKIFGPYKKNFWAHQPSFILALIKWNMLAIPLLFSLEASLGSHPVVSNLIGVLVLGASAFITVTSTLHHLISLATVLPPGFELEL